MSNENLELQLSTIVAAAGAALPYDPEALKNVTDPVAREIIYALSVQYLKAKEAEQKAREDGQLDPTGVTDLHNRRYGDRYQAGVHRKGPPGVITLDLNDFKAANDTHGHAAGDYVLKRTGQILGEVFQRQSDVKYRRGGDEFGVISPDISDPIELTMRAEEIRKKFVESADLYGVTASIGVTVSQGISMYSGETPDAVMENADLATYTSKAASKEPKPDGENVVCLYDGGRIYKYTKSDFIWVPTPLRETVGTRQKLPEPRPPGG